MAATINRSNTYPCSVSAGDHNLYISHDHLGNGGMLMFHLHDGRYRCSRCLFCNSKLVDENIESLDSCHDKTCVLHILRKPRHRKAARSPHSLSAPLFSLMRTNDHSDHFLNPKCQASSHPLWMFSLFRIVPGWKPAHSVIRSNRVLLQMTWAMNITEEPNHDKLIYLRM